MVLVFGGAYNGKLDYVLKNYNIKDEEVFFCTNKNLDYSKKVICGLHNFIYEGRKNSQDPLHNIKENIKKLENKIIICDEISGVNW